MRKIKFVGIGILFVFSIIFFCMSIEADDNTSEEDLENQKKLSFIKSINNYSNIMAILNDKNLTNWHSEIEIINIDEYNYYYDLQKKEVVYNKGERSFPKTGLNIKVCSKWTMPAGRILALFIFDNKGYLSVFTRYNLDMSNSSIFNEKKEYDTFYEQYFKYATKEYYKDKEIEDSIEIKAIALLANQV